MRNYRILPLIFVLAVSLLSAACSNYGTKLDFKKGELYYTSNVTEDEAKKLGNYLTEIDYFNDQEKLSVQLDKANDTYQVRFVVKDGIENNEQIQQQFKQLAKIMSGKVFGGAKTEVHFTDQHLKTLKVLPMA